MKIISYQKRKYTNKEIKIRLFKIISRLGLQYLNRRRIKLVTDEWGVSLLITFTLPFYCVQKLMAQQEKFGLICGYEQKTGFEVYYLRDWKDDSPLFMEEWMNIDWMVKKTKNEQFKNRNIIYRSNAFNIFNWVAFI